MSHQPIHARLPRTAAVLLLVAVGFASREATTAWGQNAPAHSQGGSDRVEAWKPAEIWYRGKRVRGGYGVRPSKTEVLESPFGRGQLGGRLFEYSPAGAPYVLDDDTAGDAAAESNPDRLDSDARASDEPAALAPLKDPLPLAEPSLAPPAVASEQPAPMEVAPLAGASPRGATCDGRSVGANSDVWRPYADEAAFVAPATGIPPSTSSFFSGRQGMAVTPPQTLQIVEKNAPGQAWRDLFFPLLFTFLFGAMTTLALMAAFGLVVTRRFRDGVFRVEVSNPDSLRSQVVVNSTANHPPAKRDDAEPEETSTPQPSEGKRGASAELDPNDLPLPQVGPTYREQQQEIEEKQRAAQEAMLQSLFDENLHLREKLQD